MYIIVIYVMRKNNKYEGYFMKTLTTVILIGKHTQLEPIQENHREILKNISQDEAISTYSPALKLKFDAWFNKALKTYEESLCELY
jgi:hypothetical protein